MKIAVNTRVLLKNELEGVGWYIHEVVRRMVLAHPEDEFIFFFDRPFNAEFIFAKNVTPVVLFPHARHPFLWYWWFEWSVAKALKKYQPDVFFSTDNWLSLRANTPTLLAVHDVAFVHFVDNVPFIVKKYYAYFSPKYLERADKIATVSEFVKDDIIKNFPNINKNKISVAHNGCREIFKPISEIEKNAVKAQYTEGSDFFFFIGAVHPRKNVHRLIAAFDLFKETTNSGLKLVICGRFAWQTGEVKRAFEQAIFKKDIIFTGYVLDSEVPKLTASAFAVTYISAFEGFGIPLLEAMNCDIPIITSNVSSMPEVAGDAAILVNPEDINDISRAMEQIFFYKNVRQKLIENGRIQRQKFDWDKTASLLYAQLKSLASA